MSEVVVTFRRTYNTDAFDPVLDQDEQRIADYFLGEPLRTAMEAEGFTLDIEKTP